MAPPEADATGGSKLGANMGNLPSAKKISALTNVNVEGLDKFAQSLASVKTNLNELKTVLSQFSTSSNSFKKDMQEVASSLKSVSNEATNVSGAVKGISAGSGGSKSPKFTAIKNIFTGGGGSSNGGSSGGGSSSGGGGGGVTSSVKASPGPSGGDIAAGQDTGNRVASVFNTKAGMFSGGIQGLLGGIVGTIGGVGGALNAGSLNWGYNRIEGPTGNRNATLQLAQALGPNATATGNSIVDTIKNLGVNTPVYGSNSDVVSTLLAGQSVGALTSSQGGAANSRNGFFESVRQMQALTPGVSAGAMSSSLANYIGNTKSQQMGQFMGQGSFTMIGQGGRYKSLAEWAEGITKFLAEQRPNKQGSGFTKEELISQNFPGSNINAWFQMMGVPADMVDYWWQYALTNAGKASPVAAGALKQTSTLQTNVNADRGGDLSQMRLRSVSANTARDYNLGSTMYGMYGVHETADTRFNKAMGVADTKLSNLGSSPLGALFSMLPTPIAEMIMPILTSMVSTKGAGLVGIGADILGGLGIIGDPIGDPAGSYGSKGGTNTSHLSPDLSKKVNAMMAANPKLKISSGYRDTVTQNRLQRQGVGKVGPASKSAHTRGWAADMGPTSELGWVAANAGKFGLQTAANAGEPWHVQAAGTMPIGDPTPIGDSSGFSSIMGLFNSNGQSFTATVIDDIIRAFVAMLTGPLGKFGLGTNQTAGEGVSLGMLPDVGPKGFSSSSSVGDPTSMMGSAPTINAKMGSPIIFKTAITIQGGSGSGMDAQRTASSIADHLETELTKRDWRRV